MANRKANGEGSIFKLPSGRWRAVVSYRTLDGMRRRRGRLAANRAEAAIILREMQNEIAAGSFREPSQLKIREFLEQWLENVVRTERAENTHYSYKLAVDNWICPYIGNKRLLKLTPLQVQSMLTAIRNDGAGDRTRQNAYVVLNAAMGRAVRWRLISSNPCGPIDKPKAERKEIFPFTESEAELIMVETEDDQYHAVFVLAITTGMRQGELFGLQWNAVDFKKRLLHVRQQATETAGRVTLKKPKTKAGLRTIELTDRAIDALRQRRAVAMKGGRAGCTFVFCSPKGNVIRRGDFRIRQWNPLLELLDFKHRGFHHLRHTYATLTLGAGVPVHLVSRVLGHSQPSITLDIYSHVIPSQQSQATDAMRRLFG